MKPIVAVVGRPNVGKSTLVNRLAQTSDAIVHESRGVTRDRSYHTADWNGREFTIVDTGGIEPLKSDDVFATSIRDQALAAAEEAAVILFVVDGRTGVTEEDESASGSSIRSVSASPRRSRRCTATAPATCSTISWPCFRRKRTRSPMSSPTR